MGRCFVIQPFDGGPFDKRFDEVLGPAIKNASFEPYRVDLDPQANIPIDAISSEIENSDVCLADISEDNPNVWFEVGFAIAKSKSLLLICKRDRREKFPFDVQHRTVVRYGTDSVSDFDYLKTQITDRLCAFSKSDKAIRGAVAASVVQPMAGLTSYEIAILVYLLENRLSPLDGESGYSIQQAVQRSGYTKAAVALGLEKLRNSGHIEIVQRSDVFGDPSLVFSLVERGMEWLVANEHLLVLEDDQSNESVAFDEYDPFADE